MQRLLCQLQGTDSWRQRLQLHDKEGAHGGKGRSSPQAVPAELSPVGSLSVLILAEGGLEYKQIVLQGGAYWQRDVLIKQAIWRERQQQWDQDGGAALKR